MIKIPKYPQLCIGIMLLLVGSGILFGTYLLAVRVQTAKELLFGSKPTPMPQQYYETLINTVNAGRFIPVETAIGAGCLIIGSSFLIFSGKLRLRRFFIGPLMLTLVLTSLMLIPQAQADKTRWYAHEYASFPDGTVSSFESTMHMYNNAVYGTSSSDFVCFSIAVYREGFTVQGGTPGSYTLTTYPDEWLEIGLFQTPSKVVFYSATATASVGFYLLGEPPTTYVEKDITTYPLNEFGYGNWTLSLDYAGSETWVAGVISVDSNGITVENVYNTVTFTTLSNITFIVGLESTNTVNSGEGHFWNIVYWDRTGQHNWSGYTTYQDYPPYWVDSNTNLYFYTRPVSPVSVTLPPPPPPIDSTGSSGGPNPRKDAAGGIMPRQW